MDGIILLAATGASPEVIKILTEAYLTQQFIWAIVLGITFVGCGIGLYYGLREGK